MTSRKTNNAKARKALVAYCEEVLGASITRCHTMNNGDIRAYACVPFHGTDAREARWTSRHPLHLELWKTESDPAGRSITSTREVLVARVDLPESIYTPLVETV